jgi:hypothetical protein
MAQYSKHYEDFLPQEKTNFEVVMIADNFGNLTAGTGATAVDAFGRLRVAETFTLGDYKHLYAIDPNFTDLKLNGGNIQYSTNKACAVMTTTSNVASRATHQTKFYHHYQPGKSQVIFSSVCFGYAQQNVTKRTGYFDDRDGIYFEQVGGATADGTTNGTLNFVVRSYAGGSASEATVGTYKRRVPQSEWNIDPCDGTGPSKFNINTSKTQLVYIDFQWLGVGRVRCGFVHDGQIVLAHEYYCSNVLSEVYMSNPNLPVRCEILNTGTTSGGSMDQICSTVMSEGGYVESGIDFMHLMTASRAVAAGATLPVLAIRLKNTFNDYPNRISVRLNNIAVYPTGDTVAFQIAKLPSEASLTGTLAWTDIDADSGVQYSVGATGYTAADADVLFGGYVTSGSSQNSLSSSSTGSISSAKKNIIVQNFDSTSSEVYVILITSTTAQGQGATIRAGLQWREIY